MFRIVTCTGGGGGANAPLTVDVPHGSAALGGIASLFSSSSVAGSASSASISSSSSFALRKRTFERRSLLSVPLCAATAATSASESPSDASTSSSSSDDSGNDEEVPAAMGGDSSAKSQKGQRRAENALRRATYAFVDQLYALALEKRGDGDGGNDANAEDDGGGEAIDDRTASLSLTLDAIVLDTSCAASLRPSDVGSSSSGNGQQGSARDGRSVAVDLVPTAAVRPFLASTAATGVGIVTATTGDLATDGVTAIVSLRSSTTTGERRRGGAHSAKPTIAAAQLVETLTTLLESLAVSRSPYAAAGGSGGSVEGRGEGVRGAATLLLPARSPTDSANQQQHSRFPHGAVRKNVLLRGTPIVALCADADAAVHCAMALHRVLAAAEASLFVGGGDAPLRLSLVFVVGTEEAPQEDGVAEYSTSESVAAVVAEVLRTGAAPPPKHEVRLPQNDEAFVDTNRDDYTTAQSSFASFSPSPTRRRRLSHPSIVVSEDPRHRTHFSSSSYYGNGEEGSPMRHDYSRLSSSVNASTITVAAAGAPREGDVDARGRRSVSAPASNGGLNSTASYALASAKPKRSGNENEGGRGPSIDLAALRRDRPMVADLVVQMRPNSNSSSSSGVPSIVRFIEGGVAAAGAMLRADQQAAAHHFADGGDGRVNDGGGLRSAHFYPSTLVPAAPTFLDVPIFLQTLNGLSSSSPHSEGFTCRNGAVSRCRGDRLAAVCATVAGRMSAVALHYTHAMLSGHTAASAAIADRLGVLGGLRAHDDGNGTDDVSPFGLRASSASRGAFVDAAFAAMVRNNNNGDAGGDAASPLLTAAASQIALGAVARQAAHADALSSSEAYVSRCLAVFTAMCRGLDESSHLSPRTSNRTASTVGRGVRNSTSILAAVQTLAGAVLRSANPTAANEEGRGDSEAPFVVDGFSTCTPLAFAMRRAEAFGGTSAVLSVIFRVVLSPMLRDAQRFAIGATFMEGGNGGIQSLTSSAAAAGGLLNVRLSEKHLSNIRGVVRGLVRPIEEALEEGSGGDADGAEEGEQQQANKSLTALLSSVLGDAVSTAAARKRKVGAGFGAGGSAAAELTRAFKEEVAERLLFIPNSYDPLGSSPSFTTASSPSTAIFSSTVDTAAVPHSPQRRTISTSTGMLFIPSSSGGSSNVIGVGNNPTAQNSTVGTQQQQQRFGSGKAQAADHYARREVLLDTALHWFLPRLAAAHEADAAAHAAALASKDAIAARLTAQLAEQQQCLDEARAAAAALGGAATTRRAAERSALSGLRAVLEGQLRGEMEAKLVDLERRYAARRNYLVGEDFADANSAAGGVGALSAAAATLEQWKSPFHQRSTNTANNNNNASAMMSPATAGDQSSGGAVGGGIAGTNLFAMSPFESPPRRSATVSVASATMRGGSSAPSSVAHNGMMSGGNNSALLFGGASSSPDTGLLRKRLRQQQNREALRSASAERHRRRGDTNGAVEDEEDGGGFASIVRSVSASAAASQRRLRRASFGSNNADGNEKDHHNSDEAEEDDNDDDALVWQSSVADDVTLRMLKEFSRCCDRWLRELLGPALATLVDTIFEEEATANGNSSAAGVGVRDGVGSTSADFYELTSKLTAALGVTSDVSFAAALNVSASAAAPLGDPLANISGIHPQPQLRSALSPRRLNVNFAADASSTATMRQSLSNSPQKGILKRGNVSIASGGSPQHTNHQNNASFYRSHSASPAAKGGSKNGGGGGPFAAQRADLLDWMRDTEEVVAAAHSNGDAATASRRAPTRSSSAGSAASRWRDVSWLQRQLAGARQMVRAAERALAEGGGGASAGGRVGGELRSFTSAKQNDDVTSIDEALSGSPTRRSRRTAADLSRISVSGVAADTAANGPGSPNSRRAARQQHHNNSYATALIQRLVRDLEAAKGLRSAADARALRSHAAVQQKDAELAAVLTIMRNNAAAVTGLNNSNSSKGNSKDADTSAAASLLMSPDEALSLDVATHMLQRATAANTALRSANAALERGRGALEADYQAASAAAAKAERALAEALASSSAEMARLRALNERLQDDNVRLRLEVAQQGDVLGEERLRSQALSLELSRNGAAEAAAGAARAGLEAFYKEGKRIRSGVATTYSDPYPVMATTSSNIHVVSTPEEQPLFPSSAPISPTRYVAEQQLQHQSRLRAPIPLRHSGHGSRPVSPGRTLHAPSLPFSLQSSALSSRHASPSRLGMSTASSHILSRSTSPAALTRLNGPSGGAGVPIPLSPPGFRSFAAKQAHLASLIDRDVEEAVEKSRYSAAPFMATDRTLSIERVLMHRPRPMGGGDATDVDYHHVKRPPSPIANEPFTPAATAGGPRFGGSGSHHGQQTAAVDTSASALNASRVSALLPKEQLSPRSRRRAEAAEASYRSLSLSRSSAAGGGGGAVHEGGVNRHFDHAAAAKSANAYSGGGSVSALPPHRSPAEWSLAAGSRNGSFFSSSPAAAVGGSGGGNTAEFVRADGEVRAVHEAPPSSLIRAAAAPITSSTTPATPLSSTMPSVNTSTASTAVAADGGAPRWGVASGAVAEGNSKAAAAAMRTFTREYVSTATTTRTTSAAVASHRRSGADGAAAAVTFTVAEDPRRAPRPLRGSAAAAGSASHQTL